MIEGAGRTLVCITLQNLALGSPSWRVAKAIEAALSSCGSNKLPDMVAERSHRRKPSQVAGPAKVVSVVLCVLVVVCTASGCDSLTSSSSSVSWRILYPVQTASEVVQYRRQRPFHLRPSSQLPCPCEASLGTLPSCPHDPTGRSGTEFRPRSWSPRYPQLQQHLHP